MAKLDLGNNVSGSLPSATSTHAVARAFGSSGWRIRKSSWTEYEVEHTFAELQLLPLEPVTFRGFVDPDRIEMLLDYLTTMGMSYLIELERPDGTERSYRCTPGGAS